MIGSIIDTICPTRYQPIPGKSEPKYPPLEEKITKSGEILRVLITQKEVPFFPLKQILLQWEQKRYREVSVWYKKGKEEICLDKVLSGRCRSTIMKIQRQGCPDKGYRDLHFVAEILGYFQNNTLNVPGKWYALELNETRLKTEEPILILNAEENDPHYALHIADGLYFTLFGKYRSLAVANLDGIMKIFNGASAYQLYKFPEK